MTTHRPRRAALATFLVAATLLAACGSSKNAPDAEKTATTKAPAADAGDAKAISLTDINGTQSLEEPAVKVVALEWTYVEDLLAVGVQPVGVADVPGYGQWVRADPALGKDVVDVGSRQEPSIERIRRLQPDLIITAAPREGINADALADIAPVLTFDAYPTDGKVTQWDEMTQTFTTIARAVGKEDRAETVLADLDAKLAEGKKTLAAADLSTESVVLAQGEGTPDAPMFRMFTDNAMVMQVVRDLGLKNGWDGEEESYGFNSVTLEGLTAAGDAWFLPVAPDDALDAFNDKYADSPIWTSLGFVKVDRVRPLGNDVWFFGGPLSADYLVDKIIAALTA
ncbi:iron-siderophore ABC transporter substrate-binding protein [soil metagenome]